MTALRLGILLLAVGFILHAPLHAEADSSISLRPGATWTEPLTGMEFVLIPSGCFNMGTPPDELGRQDDELPVHNECVDAFWMGRYEVTNRQAKMLLPGHKPVSVQFENVKEKILAGLTGLNFDMDDYPATQLDWNNAVDYAALLSELAGFDIKVSARGNLFNGTALFDFSARRTHGPYTFRLPSETEWEYACRARTTSARYWGDRSNAACNNGNVGDVQTAEVWHWEGLHNCNDGFATFAPVGSYPPNPFGLHDMLGNVWEWTADDYVGSKKSKSDTMAPGANKIQKGGGWTNYPSEVRCGSRSWDPSGLNNNNLGFRLVRELTGTEKKQLNKQSDALGKSRGSSSD